MKKIFTFTFTLSLLVFSSSFFAREAIAVCPVCTVAVVAGLEVSRMLGVDDIVTSIWIGGLILSTSLWFIDWLGKRDLLKKIKDKRVVKIINSLLIILMYFLVFVPLKLNGSIGILLNRLWGIDKIVLGTVIGSVMFLLGMGVDKRVRRARDGRQIFQFQKIVFPTLSLILASVVFYFLTK